MSLTPYRLNFSDGRRADLGAFGRRAYRAARASALRSLLALATCAAGGGAGAARLVAEGARAGQLSAAAALAGRPTALGAIAALAGRRATAGILTDCIIHRELPARARAREREREHERGPGGEGAGKEEEEEEEEGSGGGARPNLGAIQPPGAAAEDTEARGSALALAVAAARCAPHLRTKLGREEGFLPVLTGALDAAPDGRPAGCVRMRRAAPAAGGPDGESETFWAPRCTPGLTLEPFGGVVTLPPLDPLLSRPAPVQNGPRPLRAGRARRAGPLTRAGRFTAADRAAALALLTIVAADPAHARALGEAQARAPP